MRKFTDIYRLTRLGSTISRLISLIEASASQSSSLTLSMRFASVMDLDVIVVRETEVFDYGRSQDRRFKADHRRRIREELKDASTDERQRRIEGAKAEEQRLPPP